MGKKLKGLLASMLGRSPSTEQTKAAKSALKASLEQSGSGVTAADVADVTTWELQLVYMQEEEELRAATGPCTTRSMLIAYTGSIVTTTLEDVRSKAKKSFAVSAHSGIRVYLGESLSKLAFIADENEWKEEVTVLLKGSAARNGQLPARKLYVLEVMPSNQAVLRPPTKPNCQTSTPSTGTAGVSISVTSTPIELEQAVQSVKGARPTNPRRAVGVKSSGSSLGTKHASKGVKQRVKTLYLASDLEADSEDSEEDSEDEDPKEISEDELVGEAVDKLQYSRSYLEKTVEVLSKAPYLQRNGQPMYVLTSGHTGKGKAFTPFDVTELTTEHLDGKGAIKGNTLFLGCNDLECRRRGVTICEAPKFAIRCRTGSRAMSSTTGLPAYASIAAVVDTHTKRHHPIGVFAPQAASISAWSKTFAAAAAVAQRVVLSKSSANTPETPLDLSADNAKGKLPADLGTSDPEVLLMPAITPAKGSFEEFRRTRVTLSELTKARTSGAMVGEAIVDALDRNEEMIFVSRALRMGMSQVSDLIVSIRMADSAWLVQMAQQHGAEQLARPRLTTEELATAREETPDETNAGLQDGRGYYEKIMVDMGNLGDLQKKLLVALSIPGSSHFSKGFYLPQTHEIFSFDSFSPCGHAKLMDTTIKPFFEYVTKKVLGKVIVKDDGCGIERQPCEPSEESNACGFAAPFFFSKALNTILELGQQGGAEMDLMKLGTLLSAELHAMTVTSSSYAARRRQGKHDLARLVIECKSVRTEREKAKAKGGGNATVEPAESATVGDVELIKAPAPEPNKAPRSAPAQAEALGQAKRPLEPKAKPSPTKKPATAASVRNAKYVVEDDSSDLIIEALEAASAAMAKIPAPAKRPPEPQDELSTLLEGKRKRDELIAQQVAVAQKELESKMATGIIVNPELVAAYGIKKPRNSPSPSESSDDVPSSDSDE